jgi:uncharacterized protein (TIGR00106 family)
MAMVEIQVIPVGVGASLSHYIAECVQTLEEEKDIIYRLTPMGTVMEGNLDRMMTVVRKMHEAPLKKGAQRVCTNIVIDDRRDKKISLESKIAAVVKKL